MPPSPGSAALALRSAAELAVLGVTFFAAGRRAARRLRFANPAEEIGLSLALGAGICGTSLFLLAVAGGLTRTAVFALAAGVHATALPVWRDLFERLRRRGFRRAAGAFPFVPLLLAVPSFCLGLYPTSGFDEGLYHLPMARSLASSHSVDFLTNLRNPVFPQLVESLDAATMLLFGEGATTNRVECLALIAIGYALCGFGRRWGSRSGGLLAAAFFVAHLQVVQTGAGSCVDLDLTLFFIAAYFAWEVARETDDRRWLAMSAVLAGFAAGTKYLGLAVLPVLLALTLLSGAGGRLRKAGLLIAVGGAVLFPWYLWIFAQTGNPVFPLLPEIFGHSEWEKSDVMFARYASPASTWMRLAASAKGGIRGTLANASVVLSPLLFVELALAGAAAWFGARARRAFVVAAGYGGLLLANDPRFVFPSLALVAFAASLGLESLRREKERERPVADGLLAGLLAALAVLPAASVAARNLRAYGPVPATSAERSRFLRRRVDGYGAVEFLNRRYGNRYSVYFLRGEHLAYFAEGNFIGEWRGPARFGKVYPFRKAPLKLFRAVSALGADFLATTFPIAATIPDDADFRRHFRQVYFDGDWVVWRLGDF